MARINIEDDLFKKQCWFDLVIELKSADMALGALVRAWANAQTYWVPEKKPIPKEVWIKERLSPKLIECGFAYEKDGGIYMRGSEDQFAWLFQKSEAGKKSAETRSQKASAQKPAPLNTVEQRSTPSSNVERPSTSLSFSSSFSEKTFLSLSQYFTNRLRDLVPEQREREIRAFQILEEQYGDPEEICAVIESVAQRGQDIRGTPIVSLMGYLHSSYPAERDRLREETYKRRQAEERKAAEAAQKAAEQAEAEQSAREFEAREKAFLEAFPTEAEQEQAIRQFTRSAPWIRDHRGEMARQFAINAWAVGADPPGDEPDPQGRDPPYTAPIVHD